MKLFKWLTKELMPVPKTYKYTGMISDCSGRIFGTDSEDEANFLKQGFHTREDGAIVCITCGGNCGQCGTSLGRDIEATMQNLVDSLTGNKPTKYYKYEIIGQHGE